MTQKPTPIPQTHPDRQAKLISALENLGVDLRTCARCNASEPNAADLHALTQVSAQVNVILDKETEKERADQGLQFFGESRHHTIKLASLICKRCGFSLGFDLNTLEQHL